MGKTIEAIYENGVFKPLEPVSLPEGEHVQVTVPAAAEKIRRQLDALDTFESGFENLTEKQWQLFDNAVQRRSWYGDRELDL